MHSKLSFYPRWMLGLKKDASFWWILSLHCLPPKATGIDYKGTACRNVELVPHRVRNTNSWISSSCIRASVSRGINDFIFTRFTRGCRCSFTLQQLSLTFLFYANQMYVCTNIFEIDFILCCLSSSSSFRFQERIILHDEIMNRRFVSFFLI